jgi:hypothetical protein
VGTYTILAPGPTSATSSTPQVVGKGVSPVSSMVEAFAAQLCYHIYRIVITVVARRVVMVRTQIQLTEGQAKTLKRLAKKQQRSVAELIRRSIDLYLAQRGELPLDQPTWAAITTTIWLNHTP